MKKKVAIPIIIFLILIIGIFTSLILYKTYKEKQELEKKKDIAKLRKVLKKQLNGKLEHNIQNVRYQKNLRKQILGAFL